jgi:glycerophosphoryl diester phosphodiesterase
MTCVIAHRGASAAWPENTVAAFRGARSLGADWVELDVRRTADDRLAVLHDAHLADGRPLVEVPSAALPASVPSLAAALDACTGMGVNIEIKNLPIDPDFDPDERLADAVVALLTERAGSGEVLISSFNLATIDRVRALDPALPTAWLVFDESDVGSTIERTARHGHRALHPYEAHVDGDLVDRAHAAGLVVNTWTIDDPARMAELVALGVDGIVTNVPDVARVVVDRLGGASGAGERSVGDR